MELWNKIICYFIGVKKLKKIIKELEQKNAYLSKARYRNYETAKLWAHLNDETLLGTWCTACPETGCEHKFINN